jgi:hypothetical protein
MGLRKVHTSERVKASEPRGLDEFNAALTKILSVSLEELERREREWKKQRKAKSRKGKSDKP